MKIISWNVNGIRASIKKGLTDYVLAMNPDIFCVQETKAEREQVPTDNWPPAGYRDYYHSCSVKGGYSGVATFTTLAVFAGFAIAAARRHPAVMP